MSKIYIRDESGTGWVNVPILTTEKIPISARLIQKIVREGKGREAFPIGTTFSFFNFFSQKTTLWRVIAHNHHEAADETLKNTMTIQMVNSYSSDNMYHLMKFDDSEFLYKVTTPLVKGTYHFTVGTQRWYLSDKNKAFQFTINSEIPSGSCIFLALKYNETIAEKKITIYDNNKKENILETTTIALGNEGTNLGTTGNGNLNHMDRVCFGSSNYAQSFIRQFLNSHANITGKSYWEPTNKFDAPPPATYTTEYPGFLITISEELADIIQPAIIPCYTNSIFEVNSLDGTVFPLSQNYTLNDKVFLLSSKETLNFDDNLTWINDKYIEYYKINNHKRVYDLYDNLTNDLLRNIYPITASHIMLINKNNVLTNAAATNNVNVTPACIIA